MGVTRKFAIKAFLKNFFLLFGAVLCIGAFLLRCGCTSASQPMHKILIVVAITAFVIMLMYVLIFMSFDYIRSGKLVAKDRRCFEIITDEEGNELVIVFYGDCAEKTVLKNFDIRQGANGSVLTVYTAGYMTLDKIKVKDRHSEVFAEVKREPECVPEFDSYI